jgi:hypothetical protein
MSSRTTCSSQPLTPTLPFDKLRAGRLRVSGLEVPKLDAHAEPVEAWPLFSYSTTTKSTEKLTMHAGLRYTDT